MIASFKNSLGNIRTVKVGFSWTIFFFGGIPFFFRGMFGHGLLFTILGIITFAVSNIVLCFIGNKMTAKYYLDNGYTLIQDHATPLVAAKWGIVLKEDTVAASAPHTL